MGTSLSKLRVANIPANSNKKKARPNGRAFYFENSVCLVAAAGGELWRPWPSIGFEGLLGELGIKPRDLLRLRYEGLVG